MDYWPFFPARPGWAMLALVGTAMTQAVSRPQSAPSLRLPVRGEVLTAQGKARAGARVSFLSRRLGLTAPWFMTIDTDWGIDQVEAITDDAGRFEAQLLCDQEYVAWSSSDAGQGLARITDTRSAVFAGAVLALREPEATAAPVRLPVAGRAAWGDHAPLVLHVVARGVAAWSVDLPLTEDAVTLPAAPWQELVLQLRPRGGAPVWFGSVNRDVPQTHRIDLPPPTPLRVRAVRAPADTAVAGASISIVTSGVTWRLGVTDADGNCTVVLAGPANRFGNGNQHQLQIVAPDCAAVLWAPSERFSGTDPLDEAGLTLRLFPGGELRGRLAAGAACPPQRVPLLWRGRVHGGTAGQVVGRGPFLAWAEADGTFAIPGVAVGQDAELWGVLPAAWSHALAGRGVAVQALVPLAALKTNATGATDLGILDLDRFAPLDARLRLADGAPAERAWSGMQLQGYVFTQAARVARSGRARWLVPRGTEALLGAVHEGRFGTARAKAPGSVDVTLTPLPSVTGRLLETVTGAPLGGVAYGLSYGLNDAGPEARLCSTLLHPWLVEAPQMTDADGRFTACHPVGATSCQLQFRRRIEGRQRIHNEPVAPGAEDVVVEFRQEGR